MSMIASKTLLMTVALKYITTLDMFLQQQLRCHGIGTRIYRMMVKTFSYLLLFYASFSSGYVSRGAAAKQPLRDSRQTPLSVQTLWHEWNEWGEGGMEWVLQLRWGKYRHTCEPEHRRRRRRTPTAGAQWRIKAKSAGNVVESPPPALVVRASVSLRMGIKGLPLLEQDLQALQQAQQNLQILAAPRHLFRPQWIHLVVARLRLLPQL